MHTRNRDAECIAEQKFGNPRYKYVYNTNLPSLGFQSVFGKDSEANRHTANLWAIENSVHFMWGCGKYINSSQRCTYSSQSACRYSHDHDGTYQKLPLSVRIM